MGAQRILERTQLKRRRRKRRKGVLVSIGNPRKKRKIKLIW